MEKFKKLLLITDIPNPYRIPLFNKLNARLEKRGVQLKVIFGSAKQEDRLFEIDMNDCNFEYEILQSKRLNLGLKENTLVTFSGLMKSYNEFKPDKTVVIGYTVATVKLWFISFFWQIHYIIWSGSVFHPTDKHSWWRLIQRKILIKRSRKFIVYGTKAKEYLVKIGAKAEDVYIAINTTDVAYYAKQTFVGSNSEKKKIGVLSYLRTGKGLEDLLEVVKALSKLRDDFVVEIVGDGNEKEKLEKFVTENDLGRFVKFLGFKQKNEIPGFLAGCDLFLFQTLFDRWGLVLVEAMAVGVPVIASINAASTPDIIQDGDNGLITDFKNRSKTVEKIQFLLDNPEKARNMGQKGRQFILENCQLDNTVDGFIKTLFPDEI